LFSAIARFAVLAYAPSQHGKHAVISCLSAQELRDELGDRFDDVITECAIYAAGSRQPWSEPPITDPPAVEPGQPADLHSDRRSAERWLAKHYREPGFAHEYFTAAAEDFEDLGHKLIVAVTAWKLASVFPEYPTLRIGVWEMSAYRGERYEETGNALETQPLCKRLVDNMVASGGDIVSAHAVFLLDAALETKDEHVIRRVRDYLSGGPAPSPASAAEGGGTPLTPTPYRLARDYGAYLKSFAVARRLGDRRIIDAAKYNLDHAPSFEEFSLA
jgi:hypothetical protein